MRSCAATASAPSSSRLLGRCRACSRRALPASTMPRPLARLVEDLLSLSRIELNEHVAPIDRVALGPLIESVAAALELRAGEREMRLALSLPPNLPDAVGSRDELAQVFQNLIDNAIKYG